MLNMNEPDWPHEMEMCDLFLELDERNCKCLLFMIKNGYKACIIFVPNLKVSCLKSN